MEFFSASLTLWANIPYLPYFNLQLKGDIKDQIKGKQTRPSTIIHTHTHSHTHCHSAAPSISVGTPLVYVGPSSFSPEVMLLVAPTASC